MVRYLFIMRDYFGEVKKLNLPLGKYVIAGSGPLGIRGIRQCNDIDILVTHDLFRELKHTLISWRFCSKSKLHKNGKVIKKNNIEIWNHWPPNLVTSNTIKHADIIDGLPFVSLHDTIQWKRKLNREKDKTDIHLIKEYIRNRL